MLVNSMGTTWENDPTFLSLGSILYVSHKAIKSTKCPHRLTKILEALSRKVSYYHCQEKKPYVQERKNKVFKKLGWTLGKEQDFSTMPHTEGVMESRQTGK